MNKVILVGRLTKDPELRRTNNDIAVVQFTIAVNRTYQSRSGEKQADFINCVVWRQQAENLARYMRKGSLIGVEGQIQTRNFDDANGVRRYVTEVICDAIHFLESKQARQDTSGFSDINQYEIPQANKTQEEPKDPFEDLKSSFDVSNDDLPF
ncbi:MAG TPA: single-stranded DNA-binding protein [Bacilli bacterium]|nr:MAG: Single-stranded DNA-binding protein ssb [Tenericutes bacterium ADurb.BinA124]HNZ49961.1 single-stranded DNA-binding protein [Bacilli bacterium]HOH18124.1 single-stranded DNA-binding protein [Bacilli bacterium]HPN60552.1 single-stranded DNA-binding protein [Bacilli bacterium]HPX83704.1 single-stranded DNA-binding protein [Bacilli bacterium]